MWRSSWLALLIFLAPPLLAVEPLNWAIMSHPGVVNLRDGLPYDGLLVEYLQQMDGALGDARVQYLPSNHQRAMMNMRHGRNLCTGLLRRSAERDQIGYFVPLLISPPLQVVLRVSDVDRLPLLNGQLWLEQLLSSELLGGLVAQQIYPAKLQQAREAQHPQLVEVNLTSSGDRLLLMLSRKRFDYVFEYPTTMIGFAQANPQEAALVGVPVVDFTEMPVFGSYCTRNTWGLAMSQRIDTAVRSMLATPQPIEASYQRWLPAETWQQYGGQIKQFLRERAQQAPLVFAPAAP